MMAVIFEVLPHADRRQAYFDAAAALKPHLEQIDGFISVERFESLARIRENFFRCHSGEMRTP